MLHRITAIIIVLLCCGPALRGAGLTASLSAVPACLDGYADIDSVERRIATSAPAPAEGVWRLTDTGAIIAIERCPAGILPASDPETLLMVVMRSPDRSLRPGTVMGCLHRGAAPGSYDARIYSKSPEPGKLGSPKSVHITADPSGEYLKFLRDPSGASVNLWSLLPYMFRRLVKRKADNRPGVHGCVRLSSASLPRYF